VRNLLIVLLFIVAGVVGLRLFRPPNEVGQRRRRNPRRNDRGTDVIAPDQNKAVGRVQKRRRPASNRTASGAQKAQGQPTATT